LSSFIKQNSVKADNIKRDFRLREIIFKIKAVEAFDPEYLPF